MRKVCGHGPSKADIVIVGEAPGEEEELQGKPFVGQSGKLLDKLLMEAGIDRRNCYVTNVCKFRPPANKIEAWITDKKKVGLENDWPLQQGRYFSSMVEDGLGELPQEILEREPKIIVGLGNVALWAMTGEWGITDWRGSEMFWRVPEVMSEHPIPFVPTLHPASVLRNYATRPFVAHDLKQRVARRLRDGFVVPQWKFNIAPSLEEVVTLLKSLSGDVAVDVETSRGQIVCIGLAWSTHDAMCIPFINEQGAYWGSLDRQIILHAFREFCERRDVAIIGQNFAYDTSYFEDNFGIIPPLEFDTYVAQSVLLPGVPRGLGFLSSMYCDWHSYWKDDARDWDNLSDFEGLFTYNCRDCCSTWEAKQVLRKLVVKAELWPQFESRMKYNAYVYRMMQRGVIRDAGITQELDTEIEEALQERKIIVCDAAGYALNPTSPTQVSKWLYTESGCRKPARKGKAAGGTGDEELKQVAIWHPELEKPLTAILEHRSLASMRSNFLRAKLDPDGLLRSGFTSTGTETFRLTSSKNNFRRGTNLLNISSSGTTHSGNKVPNFRKAIVPPTGCTYFDCDLARADLQVVGAEAEDEDLLAKFRENVDIHYENAIDVFGVSKPTDVQREKGKTFVHLTNYGGAARTCAIKVGCTVHEADMAQRRWFAAHPGIKKWHNRTSDQLAHGRTIINAFGYRMVFFDRIEGLLPQALAWLPQSTIAILASLIHMAIEDACAEVGITIQCYDSIAGWYPTEHESIILPIINEARKIYVPYEQPLLIAMGLKTSTESWGAVEKQVWPD